MKQHGEIFSLLSASCGREPIVYAYRCLALQPAMLDHRFHHQLRIDGVRTLRCEEGIFVVPENMRAVAVASDGNLSKAGKCRRKCVCCAAPKINRK